MKTHSERPRGMTLLEAARYIDVNPATYRKMVKMGAVPPPRKLPGVRCNIIDRQELDRMIDALRDGKAA